MRLDCNFAKGEVGIEEPKIPAFVQAMRIAKIASLTPGGIVLGGGRYGYPSSLLAKCQPCQRGNRV
jgi:hypothetical protein